MGKFTLRHKILLLIAGLFFALSLRPFIARENCKRADSFSRIGSLSYALQQYKKAIFLASDFTYAYNQMALNYERMGRIDKAIEALEKSFIANPGNEAGYSELGRIYGERKMYPMAEIYFRKALSLNPENKIARIWIGICSLAEKGTK